MHPKPEPATLAYEPSVFDPAPIPFDRLQLDPRLLGGIRDLGWDETRPVQSGVIPLALDGSDVIACAETGTGKTAAFLVPMALWAQGLRSAWILLPLGDASLASRTLQTVFEREDGPSLNGALIDTAQLHLLFGLLFATGLALG